MDPATATVYVTDLGSNDVSVINETGNAVTGTIPVGSGPNGIAVDPTAHMLYVANGGENTVSVVDETADDVTATIPVGAMPLEIAVDPTLRTAYVADFGSAEVSVIDETSRTVTATVPVGDEPIGVAVDPTTHTVYVTNSGGATDAPGGNTVSVIDETTNTVTATVPVDTNPQSAAVDPTRHVVYVTNAGQTAPGGNDVSVIDESTNTVTATVAVGTAPAHVAVDPVVGTAYVTDNGSNDVSVIDETTNTVTATVPVGAHPVGVAVDPTTHNAYVADQGGGATEITRSVPTSGIPSISRPAPTRHGHAGSGDPNPNTNPSGVLGSDNSTGVAATADSGRPTVTTVCSGACALAATTEGEKVVVAATDTVVGAPKARAAYVRGSTGPVFFLTVNGGGARPRCPGYRDLDHDWVQFGFRSGAGSTFEKNATMTSTHPTSRNAAESRLAVEQVCFEAPYRFVTRPGFASARHGKVFGGVLPDCDRVIAAAARVRLATPCVTSRQAARVGGGWAVRLVFWIPPNRQDPKALG
ncbi:MAG TPA: YncE family protein [Sporichthyaceae bacterium]|nr:YncE family protein [Sporichthyaceae bacterium]